MKLCNHEVWHTCDKCGEIYDRRKHGNNCPKCGNAISNFQNNTILKYQK